VWDVAIQSTDDSDFDAVSNRYIINAGKQVYDLSGIHVPVDPVSSMPVEADTCGENVRIMKGMLDTFMHRDPPVERHVRQTHISSMGLSFDYDPDLVQIRNDESESITIWAYTDPPQCWTTASVRLLAENPDRLSLTDLFAYLWEVRRYQPYVENSKLNETEFAGYEAWEMSVNMKNPSPDMHTFRRIVAVGDKVVELDYNARPLTSEMAARAGEVGCLDSARDMERLFATLK
jgi:hypothetical protein